MARNFMGNTPHTFCTPTSQAFSSSISTIGSFVSQSQKDPNRYLPVGTFDTPKSYDNKVFRNVHDGKPCTYEDICKDRDNVFGPIPDTSPKNDYSYISKNK